MIKRREIRVLGCVGMIAALAGCASVDPQPAFRQTQDLVAERHPGEVVWLRGAAEPAIEERVAELLMQPLTPDGAAEVALLRSPALQAELEELGIAQAELAQATRLANPGFGFARISGDGESQRTLHLGADLFDWLVLPLRRRLAEAELERTRLKAGEAILDTVAGARRAAIRLQGAVALERALVTTEQIDGAAARYAKALFTAGNLTALERARFEADWAESRADLGRARLETLRLREDLARATGIAPGESWGVEAELDPVSTPALDGADLERRALERRLDLGAARWAVGALDRALALKRRTRWFPAGVEVGVERERETDGVTLTGPTVELRLPLFDTGKASVARLEHELARARWQLDSLERQARSEVRESIAATTATAELFTLYRDTVLPLRQEVLERTLLEHNQMLVGAFDLLLARRDVAAAQRRAVEALTDHWLARVELDRAAGGGWSESFGSHDAMPTAAPTMPPAQGTGPEEMKMDDMPALNHDHPETGPAKTEGPPPPSHRDGGHR